MKTLNEYKKMLHTYVGKYAHQMLCAPSEKLPYAYIVPGSNLYSTTLWDWDCWMTDIALRQYAKSDDAFKDILPEYELGCLNNFAKYTSKEGFMPICIEKEKGNYFDSPSEGGWPNMHKPVYAQHAAFLQEQGLNISKEIIETADLFLQAYEKRFMHKQTGLFYWQNDCAIGVDNDPCTYFRPPKSSGSILLNSFLYKEMWALSVLYEKQNDMEKVKYWAKRAEQLKVAISNYCFDMRDGNFYSVDFNLLPNDNITGLHSGAPRDWECLLMRFDVWSNILPLWAGVADKAQAEAVLQRFRDHKTYRAEYGIRTLSPLEKMYDLSATTNPSNWRGPVWGVANYFSWRAMLKYGYEDDAVWLAETTIRLLGKDIEETGTLHEYYHPDTGKAIMTPDFINWNALVLNMIAWLEGKECCFEF